MKLGVLISGGGSNLQALIDKVHVPGVAEIALVVSNVPEAGGLARAVKANVPACVIHHRDYADRPSFEVALDDALRQAGVELICLAGFMRVLTPWFVARWHNRMINIHPTLLPAFAGTYGLRAHQQVVESGARFSGCTVHYVYPEVDAGPIIAQAAVPVLPQDSAESLAARVLKAEHELYPLAVRLIATGRARVEGVRVIFSEEVAMEEAAFLMQPVGA